MSKGRGEIPPRSRRTQIERVGVDKRPALGWRERERLNKLFARTERGPDEPDIPTDQGEDLRPDEGEQISA